MHLSKKINMPAYEFFYLYGYKDFFSRVCLMMKKQEYYQKMGNALSEELKDMETSGKFEKLTEHKYNKLKISLDFLLLITAFAAAYFIKRGHLNVEGIYIKFLPLYFFCWPLSSLLIGKPKHQENKNESGYLT
jgi:hypothetical protein